jgi:hypothetical protein
MADILKSAGYSMPTSSGVLHTAPLATTVIVLSGAVHNPTGSGVTVTLTIAKNGGGTVYIASGVTIAAGGFFNLPDKLILESEDTLDGFCSVSGCTIGLNFDNHDDVAASVETAQQAAIDAAGYRDTASAQVALAQAEVVNCQDQVTLAEDHADNAALSATEAASSALKELKDSSLGSVSTDQSLDCSQYNYFILEPTTDVTLTFTNVSAGTACIVELLGAGDHTLTWAGATFVWDNGEAPTLAAGTDRSIVSFVSGDGTTLRGKLSYEVV